MIARRAAPAPTAGSPALRRPARWLAMAAALGACSRSEPAAPPDDQGPSPSEARPGADDVALTAPGPGRSSAPARPHPATVSGVTAVPVAVARAVRLERVVSGLDHPLAIEVAPGDSTGRLFVVERGGAIRVLRGGTAAATPFLDLGDRVSRNHDERGLLGLAFHPRYRENRRFYVNYTERGGDTRVVEYRASSADPDRADPASAREVFRLDQPYANHNGGGIEFGPDGLLWIGTGDGGSAGDPLRAGQDRRRLLAKMLRLDVDRRGARAEIAMIGLRNPWRFAFDRGDLYIGDVGQDQWEEIDVVGKDQILGANLGWNEAEGNHCYRGRRCKLDRYVPPAVEYDHRAGCSVTGGEVYRGRALPELDGVYFYADYCTALLRSFRWSRAGGARDHWDWKPVLDPSFRLSTLASFGVDAAGELYLVSLDGAIYRLVRAGAPRSSG